MAIALSGECSKAAERRAENHEGVSVEQSSAAPTGTQSPAENQRSGFGDSFGSVIRLVQTLSGFGHKLVKE